MVVGIALIPEAISFSVIAHVDPRVDLSRIESELDPDGNRVTYRVGGELFFASSANLLDEFDYEKDPDQVIIDLTDSHIWDASTVAALDQVVAKYTHRGKPVELVGMNRASQGMHDNLSGRLSSSH